MIDRRSLIKHSGAAIAALGAGMTSPSLRAFAATAVLPFDSPVEIELIAEVRG